MTILPYLRLLWRFSPAQFLLLNMLLVLSSVTQGAGLLLLVPLIDVIDGGPSRHNAFIGAFIGVLEASGISITLARLLSLFIAISILRALILFGHGLLADRLRLELLDNLRARGFDAMLDARWAWHITRRKSDLSNLLTNEIGRLGTALSYSLRLPVTIFSLFAYGSVAVALSFPMTLGAIGVGLVIFLGMARQHRIADKQGRALSEANRQVQRTVEEGLAGIKLVKIFGGEIRLSLLMRSIRDQHRGRTLAFARLNGLMTAIFQISIALAMAALIYIGTGPLGLASSTLLVLVVLFARLAPLIQELQRQINGLMHANAALDGYLETLRLAEDEAEHVLSNSDPSRPPLRYKSAITLENVCFSYAGRTAPSLNHINLTIPFRKTTAIIGPSGSGKSTLAELIMGMLQPAKGVVAVDGVPLDRSNFLEWRRSIAYMPQDIFLFHDSIRNNLLWVRADASDAELETALKQAAANFTFTLPNGIDTVVGDLGHRLSGGEKQRIALARVILQKPELMILDEATSALDPLNEALICRTIRKLHDDLTIVVLGHRKSISDLADHVVVLENGQVKDTLTVAPDAAKPATS